MRHTIWGKLPRHNGYWVSIDGDVVSFRTNGGNISKDIVTRLKKENNRGYKSVRLANGDGTYKHIGVHRCVVLTFLANPENKSDCNHIDGVKDNNSLENLEWATPLENERHSWGQLGKRHKLEDCRRRSDTLTKNDYKEITVQYSRETCLKIIALATTHTNTEIVKELNVNKNSVTKILKADVIHLKKHSKGAVYDTIQLSN